VEFFFEKSRDSRYERTEEAARYDGGILLVLDKVRKEDLAGWILLQDDIDTGHGNLDGIAEIP
jgi:hypothetical protein